MELKEIAADIANGRILFCERNVDAGGMQWNAHPKFEGVYLKNLILGRDTDEKISCHIVRIDPHCTLEMHVHGKQWELHEVIAGDGTLHLDSKTEAYHPGCMAIIPNGTSHSVIAGKNGMVLLAKFFPPLM